MTVSEAASSLAGNSVPWPCGALLTAVCWTHASMSAIRNAATSFGLFVASDGKR